MQAALFPARHIVYVGILVFLLSTTAHFINLIATHYPGNNYFPPEATLGLLVLIIVYLGLTVLFGKNSYWTIIGLEFFFFFLVMALILFATNAIQYTPFPPIDLRILPMDMSLHIHLSSLLSWVAEKPLFKILLEAIYNSLTYQLLFIPLLVIATKGLGDIREYYFLLLISTLIGFTFYYFFPTTAPASILNSPFFSEEQQATGLKFSQIHDYIPPSTMEGGMISLPSFHVIWAWFSLYLVRGWLVGFLILLPINGLLMASCLLLGWHYAIDILGAFLVIVLSHAWCWKLQKQRQ
jgi:hypothetical protein